MFSFENEIGNCDRYCNTLEIVLIPLIYTHIIQKNIYIGGIDDICMVTVEADQSSKYSQCGLVLNQVTIKHHHAFKLLRKPIPRQK